MRKVYGWSLAVVICMVAVASAQVRPRPAAVPPATGPAAAPAAHAVGTADQQIAACLYFGAHNEVELAKFAENKAKSDDVKDFAAEMIKDHSRQADKLARLAGNLVNAGTARAGGGVEIKREVRKVPAEEGREEAREDRKEGREKARETGDREQRREGREEAREDRRDERTVTTTITRGQGFSWVAIHHEMGEQCLESAKKELGNKEGHEFDQCYIGMQIGAHMHMLDALKVFKNHTTGELQQDIEESIDTTQAHLKEAKKIMEELKDKK
jgi:predicted outer membrane protein